MIEVVQTIQTSIEIVGKLLALSKKIGDADFKMLIADLSNELGDAKLEAANLKNELASLRQENTDLKQRLERRENDRPIYADGVYNFEGEDGQFCTSCFDTGQRKIRVRRLANGFEVFGKWECPSCNATFG
ncbi:MAG: hypothetical protein EP321_03250 [Sphingomonadales bacterium]|nr:MAG: hypothetical protein EP345_09130 [Sphingomonadales bacterium]TNF05516.1 MAG: hypothetical protein EP321_03250 [Sphingomonadales bacterium]